MTDPQKAFDSSDSSQWLHRFSAREWVFAGMEEARKAERAYLDGDTRGGLAAARRGAGMALNAVLLGCPELRWGRTYVEHLQALVREKEGLPDAVHAAAQLLLKDAPSKDFVLLRVKQPKSFPEVEAARDVIAHAYARCRLARDSHEPREPEQP